MPALNELFAGGNADDNGLVWDEPIEGQPQQPAGVSEHYALNDREVELLKLCAEIQTARYDEPLMHDFLDMLDDWNADDDGAIEHYRRPWDEKAVHRDARGRFMKKPDRDKPMPKAVKNVVRNKAAAAMRLAYELMRSEHTDYTAFRDALKDAWAEINGKLKNLYKDEHFRDDDHDDKPAPASKLEAQQVMYRISELESKRWFAGHREDYARRKASPGQLSLWKEEEHPRQPDGEFAPKGEGAVLHKGDAAAHRKAAHDAEAAAEKPEEPADPFHDFTDDERSKYDETVDMLQKFKIDKPEPREWIARVRAVANRNKGKADERVEKPSGQGEERGLPTGERLGSDSAGKHQPGTGGKPGGRTGELRAGDDTRSADAGGGPAKRGNDGAGGEGASGQLPAGGGTGDAADRGVGASGGSGGRKSRRPSAADIADQSEGNYRYTTEDFADFGGAKKRRFKANLDAIRVLKTLELEEREHATPEEKEVLAKYTGFGALPEAFNYGHDWRHESQTLNDELSEADHASLKRSTPNAHFTSPKIVKAQWKAAERMGFKGGRFLETSAGVGYYLGMMPEELAKRTKSTAVELDTTTGKILQKLYPSANVKIGGFQDLKAPDNHYDFVASNVPFGDYGVHDPRYNKHDAHIHDYFFLKSADLVKPGGIVQHITSTGTMDKPDDSIRRELSKTCDFVAALRMPGSTHAKNAGTEVVTDMVILRKRRPGEKPIDETEAPAEAEPKEPGFTGTTTDSLGRTYHWVNGKRVKSPWLNTTTVPDPAGGAPIPVNEYFANFPDQVLGKLDRTGSMYRGQSVNVSASDDFEADLNAAIERLPEGILNTAPAKRTGGQAEPEAPQEEAAEPMPVTSEGLRHGSLVFEDGKLMQRQGDAMIERRVTDKDLGRIKRMLHVRDALHGLITEELAGGEDVERKRAALGVIYDHFVKDFGPLNAPANRKAFADDPDAPVLASLERFDPKTGKAEKADIFSKSTIRPDREITKAENAAEGLAASLQKFGGIDIDHIAKLTGKDADDIEFDLVDQGLAFESPSGGWQTADEYLSGNVRKKLLEAREAAANDPKYKANLEALEKVQPADLDHTQVECRLGTPWIPKEDIARFAADITGAHVDDFKVRYNPTTGGWMFDVPHGYSRGGRVKAQEVWATKQAKFDEIVHAALNNKELPIYGPEKDDKGALIFNAKATDDAKAKIQEVKDAFREWIWEDDERRTRLLRHYNDNFNNVVERKFDGSHLTFPGMNPAFQMRDIQKNFVWRTIQTGSSLAGHEVGTGKTMTLIATAMELRRLGLAKKPAIACLKTNIGQIVDTARSQYPNAKILSTAGNLSAEQRKKLISSIATGDYDIVFLTHDHLDMLDMTPETQQKFIEEEIAELEAVKRKAWAEDPKKTNAIVKQLEKQKLNLEKKLKAALESDGKDDAVYFEQTGIDHLLVDEAHFYKSLPVRTGQTQLKGVPTGESDRATSMAMRCRWLQAQHNGRGVTMVTGTPIANTMAELYNFQRYLQPQELKDRGIYAFDAWAAAFGDIITRTEFTVSGEYKPVSRFGRFVNIPEIMQIVGQTIDFQRADNLKNPDGTPVIKRPKRHDKMILSPKNELTEQLMESLKKRADKVKRGGRAEKGKDNMLVICTDGRKGAIDPRLVFHDAPDNPDSKANKCVAEVLRRYKEQDGKTQLIFSNIGVNPDSKTGFHLYGDIIDKLVKGGIPREEIADFSKLEGAKKADAMAKMREGKVRIGIGSTEKLGTGVNVQRHLSTVHHLDVPWLPAALEQRNGRAWRQKNLNTDIDILPYVQEGSLDQTFWQIIGNKSNFIRQITDRSGASKGPRVVEEEDEEELTPDQLMAAASGDPRIMEKVQLEDDLKKLRSAHDRHEREQAKFKRSIEEKESGRSRLAARRDSLKRDIEHLNSAPDFSLNFGDGSPHTDRVKAAEALKEKAAKADRDYDEQQGRGYSRNYADDTLLGYYRGLTLYRTPRESFKLVGPSGEEHQTGDSLASIEYVARNLSKKLADEEANLSQNEKDIENLRPLLGKKFTQGEKLTALAKRVKELEDALRAEKAKNA